MLQRLISMFSIVITIYFVYKYRYRVMNLLLSKRLLRKLAVSFAMQIPFVRDKIVGSVLQFNRPQTF
ncbi:sodium:proton antiporter [Halalkalibacter sp. APA_J-10(15)]|uniref:sodium:proton antiporter n=1 Tax=unclassified Halalkalibacter TaxID=2893063 RepID=UPI001FF36100|nr:sodium:proton antiporter [Halalkalibacter sp. APA_J-10(15)]MCK0471514.1 sodium:proton antiporter [Halalkalibacter sp. APA_J-10(15)]